MEMLRPAEDYHELNAGVQRDEPIPLNAPALTWHVAFWLRKTPTDPNDAINCRERVKEQLDIFILHFCNSLKHDCRNIIDDDIIVDQCITNNVLLFSKVADRASFTICNQPNLTWREKEIRKSGINSISIHFTWRAIRISMRVELHTEYFSITTFAELRQYSGLTELTSNIDNLKAYIRNSDPHSADDSRLVALRKYFFYDFWETYRDQVVSFYTNVAELLNATDPDNIFKDSLFCDLRGMILSETAVKLPDYDFFFSQNKACAPSWGGEAKKRFQRLLDIRRQGHDHPYECAINYVLDGRGLYMSALGPQVPEVHAEQRIPVEYIVYVHQNDPYDHNKQIVNPLQLGRLVTQLHLLGTLRLAAIKDITALHKVGRDIGALAVLMQVAREYTVNNDNRAFDAIRLCYGKVNEITSEFLRERQSALQYRIERSRYYVSQFMSKIKLLRIKRLEGDQPYDQFVERRLGAEFEFIDRLGTRYERSLNNIATIDNDYHTRDVHKTQGKIWAIQKGGEVALFVALLPYYMSSVVLHIVSDNYRVIVTIIIWAVLVGNYAALLLKELKQSYGGTVTKSGFIVLMCLCSGLWAALWYLPVKYYFAPQAQTEQDEAQDDLQDVQSEQSEWQNKLLEGQRQEIALQNEQREVQRTRLEEQDEAQDKLQDLQSEVEAQSEEINLQRQQLDEVQKKQLGLQKVGQEKRNRSAPRHRAKRYRRQHPTG